MTSYDLLDRHACEIVEDLIPVYTKYHTKLRDSRTEAFVEQPTFLSENDTKAAFIFVEEHLKNCPHCRTLFEMVQEDFEETFKKTDMKPPRFRQKYHVHLAIGIVCATAAATCLLALLI